jgi:hypothetical protein
MDVIRITAITKAARVDYPASELPEILDAGPPEQLPFVL